MNSSTSSSRTLLVALATAAGLFAASDALVLAYAGERARDGRFIDAKRPKILHMGHRVAEPPDAVLVGSSRTLYHSSTRVLAAAGLDVYNLGVSGISLSDYPSLVDAALAQRPRWIVLGAAVPDLHRPLPPPRPLWADVTALAHSGQAPGRIADAALRWLVGLHALHLYRVNAYERAAALYHRFDPSGDALPSVSGAPRPDGADVDCSLFEFRRIGHVMNGKCRNGDALLVGEIPPAELAAIDAAPAALDEPHPEVVALLRLLRERVARTGSTRLALVLQPALGRRPTRSAAALEAALALPVLDATDLPLPPDHWADEAHLNLEGRRRYSEALARSLRGLD